MKKFWIVLLSLLLSLACVMGFAACDETPPDDETGGTVQPGDPGKPHEHDFGEWTVTVPATCTEAGEEQRVCSCGETETRYIPMAEHTFGEWEEITAAACTDTGMAMCICTECGTAKAQVLAALGHHYVSGTCTNCGDTLTATDDSYFIFTELEDGTYSVAWDKDTDLPAEVVIPWEYNGKPVTQVGDLAFRSCDDLKSVTIPNGIVSIGEYAFGYCDSLWSVTIQNGILSIGDSAFSSCDRLASIVIPDSVISVGYCAFAWCENLENVTIGDGVTFIGERSFWDCESLTSVTIGSGVTSIGEEAFSACDSLTSISVAPGNSVYHSDGNCLIETESKTLIWGSNTSVIPDDGSVTSIGNWAFASCDSLTSITIPDSVTSIGGSAFSGCSGLTNITIPDSVTSIGGFAFYYCDSLTSVTIGDSVTSIGESAFNSCASLTSVTIGDSVTSIGNQAFDCCTGLTSIVIPDSVTSIGNAAFNNCMSLTSINIPNSVISIGERAFSYCTYLKYNEYNEVLYLGNDTNPYVALIMAKNESLDHYEIHPDTKIVAGRAFYYCSDLINIVIPDSVTSIGEDAFYSCDSLTGVYITDIAAWCAIDFGDYEANPLYYAHNLYLNGELVTDLVIPDSVTSIGDYAFEGCTSLTSVIIPDSVTSIGSNAFCVCINLTSVTIPDNVTSIGNIAFWFCGSLTSAIFENPNGWSAGGEAISAADLADPATAAQYLRGTYYRDIWTRA